MDLLHHIALGAQVLFTPTNLFFCFIGVLMGTLVGVLPGLGPTAAIALLLPNTFHVTPVAAIIMLAGIYYGAMYGGSTTSILVNIPGEAASVVTCLDGRGCLRHRGLRFIHRRNRFHHRLDACGAASGQVRPRLRTA
jgi:putative tricarboxylic transport membrane protein